MLSVPSGAPTNVRLRNYQENEILVQWNAVRQQEARGKIKGYTVYYYNSDHEGSVTVSNPTVFQVILHGLTSEERYEIAVAAFTSVGEGPQSARVSVTVGEC